MTHTDNNQQQTDPTTGRVIPTREQVANELSDIYEPAIDKITATAIRGDIDALNRYAADAKKEIVAYIMQQISQNYHSNVNLGISIGRKEMVAAMETVIPDKKQDPHKGNIAYGNFIGFNEAVDEAHKRLKAMVGVLEQGSLPDAVDASVQGHKADNLSEKSAPDDISLCPHCDCMTHTTSKEWPNATCGKCGGYK